MYRSGSGFSIHVGAGSAGAPSTRYGGIVDRIDAFRSRHIHAVSTSTSSWPHQIGVAHSAGQPDHGDGPIGGPATAVRRPLVDDLDTVRVAGPGDVRADRRRRDRRRVVAVRCRAVDAVLDARRSLDTSGGTLPRTTNP